MISSGMQQTDDERWKDKVRYVPFAVIDIGVHHVKIKTEMISVINVP